jgi:hypothetical protein
MWGVEDTTTHHIVAPRLEHQPFANPIEFPQKMLPFFTHIGTFQRRAAYSHYPNGITTSMAIDTVKSRQLNTGWQVKGC